MIKIIIKGIIYLCSVGLIIFLLNRLVPTESQPERNRINQIMINADKIESLTMGRSHAASLDYNNWDKVGANLALGGRDFASIKYMLDYFITKMPKLKEVVLIASYTSFYFDNYAMSQGNLNDARKTLYYSIPSNKIIDKNDINNYFFGKYLPFIQADNGYSWFKSLLKQSASIKLNNDNWSDSYMNEDEIKISGKIQANRDILDIKSALNFNANIFYYNKSKLCEIIELCKKRNVKLYLVIPAFHNAYSKEVPQNKIFECKKMLNYFSIKYNIPFLDLSNDSILSNKNEFYHNADHLNQDGKIYFTEKLLKLIHK